MLKVTPIDTSHKGYAFVEELMNDAFPIEERRDNDKQRAKTDHNPLFTVHLITDEKEDGSVVNVGFITSWNLGKFHFLEHFATGPEVRNMGYGKQVLSMVIEQMSGLIILEVEEPEDELSRRRIGFYERNGFKICPNEYMQPPYRPNNDSLPLKLMYRGQESLDADFEYVRDTLYREVYEITDNKKA